MILFDTNVLLDIATADPIWLAWSEKEFRAAAVQGPIPINPIIYAELAPAFASAADLDRWLDPMVFRRLPLPYAAGWVAAQAFLKYGAAAARRLRLCRTFSLEHTRKLKAIHSSHVMPRVIALIFQTSRSSSRRRAAKNPNT